MVFYSYLLSFLLFLYAAMAPVFDYTVSSSVGVLPLAACFFVLAHLAPMTKKGG